MGYDAIKALSNNSRGQKPAVRKGKSTEKREDKPKSQKNDMPKSC
jgi:hypothetical protein